MDNYLPIDAMMKARRVNYYGDEFKVPPGDLNMSAEDIKSIHNMVGVHVVGPYSDPLIVFKDLFRDEPNIQRLWEGILPQHSQHKGYLVPSAGSDHDNKVRVVTTFGARLCAFVSGDLSTHLTIDTIVKSLFTRRYDRLKMMTADNLRKTHNDLATARARVKELEATSPHPGDLKAIELYEMEREELLEKLTLKDKIIDLLECEEMSPFVPRMSSNSFQPCDLMVWVLSSWYYHRAINHHADKMYPHCSIKPSDKPYKIKPNFEMMVVDAPRTGGWGDMPAVVPDPLKLYLKHSHLLQVLRRVTDFIERYGEEAEHYLPHDLKSSLIDIDRINRIEMSSTIPLRQKLFRVNLWCFDNDNEVMTGLVRPVFTILDPEYCDVCDGGGCKQIVEFNASTGYNDTAKIKIMRVTRAVVAFRQMANANKHRDDEKWAESLVSAAAPSGRP